MIAIHPKMQQNRTIAAKTTCPFFGSQMSLSSLIPFYLEDPWLVAERTPNTIAEVDPVAVNVCDSPSSFHRSRTAIVITKIGDEFDNDAVSLVDPVGVNCGVILSDSFRVLDPA